MPHAGGLLAKGVQDAVTLLSSTTRTATLSGSAAVRLPRPNRGVGFVLDVTAAATGVGDTLDVFVQTLINGSTWSDVVHYTQVLGNGGAKRFVAKVTATDTQAMFENSAALAAGSVRNICGDQWRVRADVVDAGGGVQSFTFSVTAIPF